MTSETLPSLQTGLNQIQNILNLAKPKVYHKIALVRINRIQQSPKVLRTSGAIQRNPVIKISLQIKVEENRTLIFINLFLEDLEVLSKLISKRHMRRGQQRNTGIKRLRSNKLEIT